MGFPPLKKYNITYLVECSELANETKRSKQAVERSETAQIAYNVVDN